jgi:nucleotide-binding universal stress UspA family protein
METTSMKILLAYDGSPASEAAAQEVARRPWPPGSEIRLITVLDRPFPPSSGIEVYAPVFEQMKASYREEAYNRIQLVLARFRFRTDLAMSYEIREGSAKQALLEAIQEWKADLVVAGSDGAKGLAGLFLGSVCHALVTHAACNVEVIKPRTGKTGEASERASARTNV